MPSYRKESGYLIIKDFALHPRLALMATPAFRLSIGTEKTFLQNEVKSLHLSSKELNHCLDQHKAACRPQQIGIHRAPKGTQVCTLLLVELQL